MGNPDITTDIGRCRNCNSNVFIQKKGYSINIYYVENEHGQKERVVPIWRTLRRRKNCETLKTSKYRKNGGVSFFKLKKSRETSGYVKSYNASNYKKT